MKIEDASNIYLGSSQVSKIYSGSTQVWPIAPMSCNISGYVTQYAISQGITAVPVFFNRDSQDNAERVDIPIDSNGYFELTSIPMSITTPIVSLDSMFYLNMYSHHIIQSLTFDLDVSSCKTMQLMLMQEDMTSLNTTLNATSLRNLDGTFEYCKSLTTIDLSNWTLTASVPLGSSFTMVSTFEECRSLTNIIWPSTINAMPADMTATFAWCDSITTIDLSDWDLRNLRKMNRMFDDCHSLTTIIWPSTKIPQYITSPSTRVTVEVANAYRRCTSLREIDLSFLAHADLRNTDSFFDGCTSLEVIRFGDAYINIPSYSYHYVFRNCTSLTDVYINNATTLYSLTDTLAACDDTGTYQLLPSTVTIHYNGTTPHDYVWNGSAWV